jgi:hypothetical protein
MKTQARKAAIVMMCATSVVQPLPAADTPPARTGSVILVLEDGAAPRTPGQREGKDMELELTLKDGNWGKEAWGYCTYFNRSDHDGTLEATGDGASGTKMRVALTIRKDFWFPVSPGQAEYRLDVRREGDRFEGAYTGTMRFPDNGGIVTNETKGKVTGRIFPLWHEPVPGFVPLQPGEHPRLVFRKADLPTIKKRMATPEGEAIMARFHARLGYAAESGGKLNTYPAAGLGLAYQLTGDAKYADQARAAIEDAMAFKNVKSVVQDIHYAPYVLGVALAYDFCYDGWEPAFRAKVTRWLDEWCSNLTSGSIGGKTMNGYNPSPWSNHNGIRSSCAGMAAIALLGEKDEAGKPLEGIEHKVWLGARETRRHMVYGQGYTGWGLEGDFYKTMTYNAGPGHFVQAYRTAVGGDVLAGWPGAFTLLGEWLEKFDYGQNAGSGQTSGMWPTCLATVPSEYLPALRFLYDRAFGLQGNRSFGIDFAYHAGYVIAAYPFDVAAKNPDEVIPWAVPDLRHGRHVFRKPWKGADDLLTIAHLRSEVYRASWCIERSGASGDLKIWGLGKQWVNGVSLPSLGAINQMMGGVTTYFDETGDGAAVFGARFDDYYWTAAEKSATTGKIEQPGKDKELVWVPRWAHFVDHGVRMTRHMAVDYSGLSGAPALFVIVDRIANAPAAPQWNLKTAGGLATAIEGNAFTLGEKDKLHLRGLFVSPAAARIEPGLSATPVEASAQAAKPATPEDPVEAMKRRLAALREESQGIYKKHDADFFVVFTLQNGPAPAIKVEGKGLDAAVTVGKRTIRFDGKKAILGRDG